MISDEVYTKEMHRLLKARDYLKHDRETLIKTAFETFKHCERDAHLEDMERALRQYKAAKKALTHVPLEKDEQKAVVLWFHQEFPTKKIMSVRNDGFRLRKERIEQIEMGLLPGASDLLIPHITTWVEMKRANEKLSVWSEEQQEFARYINEECEGQIYLLCYGFEDAKQQILQVIENKSLVNNNA